MTEFPVNSSNPTYAMLRYATLRYATLRYATLRYATLRYATLRYATLRYAMLCYAMLCYAMLCYAMLCCAMLCSSIRHVWLVLKCFSYVESKFYHVNNDFMDFSLDFLLFPSVNFFKTTSSCYTISKVRHIRV